MEIGEKIWRIVDGWDYLSKKTIGTQLIEAADSIAANISEGFGRFHYKEAKQFSYFWMPAFAGMTEFRTFYGPINC